VDDLRARTTLFCGVIAAAIALSMLLRGRRAVHWLFAGFTTEVGFWYVSQSIADLSKDRNWMRVTVVLTVLLPQFAVHLFQAIVPHDDDAKPRLPRAALMVGIPMLALAVSPYARYPLASGAVYLYVFGFLAAALWSLWMRGKKSDSKAVRDRVRFLVAVGGLAMGFTLADLLSIFNLNVPPLGAVLSVVFLFVLSESLRRPRLADLYELSGRLLVSTALAFAIAGLLYFFMKYMGRFGSMYLNGVLAAICVLVLFDPLEAEVEKRIHQFVFRERYDLETNVTELRKRLAHTLEVSEMVETVMTGLERSRRITSSALYLLDEDGTAFLLSGAIGANPPERLEVVTLKPLLTSLDASFALDDVERMEGSKEAIAPLRAAADTFGDLRSSVVLAVRDGGDLVGLLCVDDERVKDPFTPEEIALLETVGSQIGVALSNTRGYAKLKDRDRLAAMGSMAAGLAHEVKNPLGAIKGAAQLLEELAPKGADAEEFKEFIGIILEETNRLNRVVGSFLDYARPGVGDPVALDVNAAIRRTVQILTPRDKPSLELQLDLADDLPRAKIDAEQLRQVLINLVQNGIQAMDGHGKITITTARRKKARAGWEDDSRPGKTGANAAEITPRSEGGADLVELTVRDTGPGIAEKILKNLFVPFFTTKQRGTGLGLAISQSIVQSAGGTIEVNTKLGAGTKFIVLLPAAPDGALSMAPPGAERTAAE
jgi:signal transduction histidine kinase